MLLQGKLNAAAAVDECTAVRAGWLLSGHNLLCTPATQNTMTAGLEGN